MKTIRLILASSIVALTLFSASGAQAVPAFARKYEVGCNFCHTINPQLNRFGRDFRDNGFRLPEEVEKLLSKKADHAVASHATPSSGGDDQGKGEASSPKGSGSRGDFWSFIPEQIPFSIQAKFHDFINPKGDVTNDFQLEELQLQSGGTLTPRVSYYLHHHLVEEGEPGELYAGWVRINNLFGSNWLNLTVGQTELPLTFSPEIERLSSFEYLVLDRDLGANPFTIGTPQLGLQIFGQSDKGTKIWAGVANGFGLSINEATESNDNNSFKDFYGRIGQEVGEHFFGGYAYYGRARGSLSGGELFSDSFFRVGGDAFLNFERAILYGTLLYARDENPLGTGERRSFYGGFVECDLHFSDRSVMLLRFDGVHQGQPSSIEEPPEEGEARSAGEDNDEEPVEFRQNTLAFTPGIEYLVLPNMKVSFEYQVRQKRAEDRAIAQIHLAF